MSRRVIEFDSLKTTSLKIASYINQKILALLTTVTRSIEDASTASGTSFEDGDTLQEKFDNGDIVPPTKLSELDDDTNFVLMTQAQYDELNTLIDKLNTSAE